LEASAAFPKPRVGTADESTPLPGVDGEFRGAEAVAAPGLDLDEDDGSSSSNDEIQLDPAGSDVAGNDAVPLGREIVGRPGFAFVTQREVGGRGMAARGSPCRRFRRGTG
jgi:hypothetical protein